MRNYSEPTGQIGAGFSSVFKALDGHARAQQSARGRHFIEVSGVDGQLHTCLVEQAPEPFRPEQELAAAAELLRALRDQASSRHNAVSLINGVVNGLLGQRGYAFTQCLVAEDRLTAEALDRIRHGLRYDPDHPAASPTLATVQAAAHELLQALEAYAAAHGLDLSAGSQGLGWFERRSKGGARRPFLAWLCPFARFAGFGRLCATE